MQIILLLAHTTILTKHETLDSDDDGATKLTPGIGYRMRATSGAQSNNALYDRNTTYWSY